MAGCAINSHGLRSHRAPRELQQQNQGPQLTLFGTTPRNQHRKNEKWKKKISFGAEQKLCFGANTQMGWGGGGAAATCPALPMLSGLQDYNTPRFPLPGGAACVKEHFLQLLPNPNCCRA